jgi:Ribbon-helix-helix domain
MIKRQTQEPNRDGILGTLARFGRGKVTPSADYSAKGYVPPSRRNRKSITTWQDEAVLKELKDISHERGIPQQVLIAEGLNYLLTKYRRRTIATGA